MKSTNKLKNKFILNCSTQDYLKKICLPRAAAVAAVGERFFFKVVLHPTVQYKFIFKFYSTFDIL